MFELADDLGGRIYIDLNTGPYYAAVISSHGYPAGNDTNPMRANGITNMDQGVYITYTLITNIQLDDQQVSVLDGQRGQVFGTLLSPFSIKHQENRVILISSSFWADTKTHPVFLLAYKGMVATVPPF